MLQYVLFDVSGSELQLQKHEQRGVFAMASTLKTQQSARLVPASLSVEDAWNESSVTYYGFLIEIAPTFSALHPAHPASRREPSAPLQVTGPSGTLGSWSILFEDLQVRIWQLMLNPRENIASVLQHQCHDCMLVDVDSVEAEQLRFGPLNNSTTVPPPCAPTHTHTLRNGRGHHHWLPRHSHQNVFNVDYNEPYRGVLIELLAPEEERLSRAGNHQSLARL
jgi:hypothetical protein